MTAISIPDICTLNGHPAPQIIRGEHLPGAPSPCLTLRFPCADPDQAVRTAKAVCRELIKFRLEQDVQGTRQGSVISLTFGIPGAKLPATWLSARARSHVHGAGIPKTKRTPAEQAEHQARQIARKVQADLATELFQQVFQQLPAPIQALTKLECFTATASFCYQWSGDTIRLNLSLEEDCIHLGLGQPIPLAHPDCVAITAQRLLAELRRRCRDKWQNMAAQHRDLQQRRRHMKYLLNALEADDK